eukprot:COSAG01_NODE_52383_length_347_cov_0.625000_1_plen_48_part_10
MKPLAVRYQPWLSFPSSGGAVPIICKAFLLDCMSQVKGGHFSLQTRAV